jgi:hypothetical protein
MKKLCRLLLISCTALSVRADSDEFFDRLSDRLSFSGAGNEVRAHLSGTLDLEGYTFSQPPPGLIYANGNALFNPRLTLFLDSQLGNKVYGFVQARADRGFDPADARIRLRLDEYALRFTPWEDGRFQIEVGKFGSVVGNWIRRHGSWEDPFITAPLPYENLTGIWDIEPAPNVPVLLQWSHLRPPGPYTPNEYESKELTLPIIWGPSYNHGASFSGKIGALEFAGEVKSGSLSSRPTQWGASEVDFSHPTFSGEISYHPSPTWNFGVSGSSGSYLQSSAVGLPPGRNIGDYREIVFGQDFEYAWHHLQIWAEIYEARFENPWVGNPTVVAYYAEAKYKFTPQFSGAIRWNQEAFGKIEEPGAGPVRWGRDTWQIDVAPTYRFTRHTQLKLQYSLQHGYSELKTYGHSFAAQFTLRF